MLLAAPRPTYASWPRHCDLASFAGRGAWLQNHRFFLAKQITQEVYSMIFEVFSSGPFETNTILLGCETTKKGAIIDAPPESRAHILGRIEALGLHVDKI